MKAVNLVKALGVALCVAVASSAYAQASDTAASDAMSAKADARITKKTDRRLGLDVRRALGRAQGIDVSNIFVRARGGAVTLTGSVPDGDQIAKAGDVAKGVAGVKSVSNKISLAPQNGS